MVGSTRDLGINASSGKARRTAIPAQRIAKARKRGLKAKFVHNQTGKGAARLYKGGIHPVSAFGIEALGAAPTTLKQLRASAAKLSPYAGAGACATTAIDLGHGKAWDPAVRLRVQIIDTWMETWSQQKGRARHEVAVAWDRIARRLKACRPSHRWRTVNGPISVVVATLLDLGWMPSRADQWVSDNNVTWRISKAHDPAPLLNDISRVAHALCWEAAANHHLGGGLQGGADLTAARAFIAKEKRKKDKGAPGLAGAIIVGSCWDNARRHSAYPSQDPMCLRCGAPCEDPSHRHYGCPDNVPQDPPPSPRVRAAGSGGQ